MFSENYTNINQLRIFTEGETDTEPNSSLVKLIEIMGAATEIDLFQRGYMICPRPQSESVAEPGQESMTKFLLLSP